MEIGTEGRKELPAVGLDVATDAAEYATALLSYFESVYEASRPLNDDCEFSAETTDPLLTAVARSDATALNSTAGVPSPTPAFCAPVVSISMSKVTSTPVAV